jgi:SAM-dependent methyltransferase
LTFNVEYGTNLSMYQEEENKIVLDSAGVQIIDCMPGNWYGSALHKESTLHQLAPYIGKMKSTMAQTLIKEFSHDSEVIYDPFCGAGTVALEAWAAGRYVLATDLNPYAIILTRAKLFPIPSVDNAITEINQTAKEVNNHLSKVDIETIPQWVKDFFHPGTLREITAWTQVLKRKNSDFLLACLFGILHHQRPGFLSYPSSHTVPYLRYKKFPKNIYPELYEYRKVKNRLEKKARRALKRLPDLNYGLYRQCLMQDAAQFKPNRSINAIITSPPYMRQLDYGRDNRLRLWFLGIVDWKALDKEISPPEKDFIQLMKKCLEHWCNLLAPGGRCVLVLGDAYCRSYNLTIPDTIAHIAIEEVKGYSMLWRYTEEIPTARRVRRNCSGSTTETILVLQKTNK